MSVDPFAGRLMAREKIVWSDRPRQGLLLTRRDLFLIPFSVMWGGFAIFWETAVVTKKAPVFMILFGVPFVLIGLFLILGRLPFDAWLRARVRYAVTDRRVLILRQDPWGSFNALALDRLADLTLNETSNGRGTIRFAQSAAMWSGYGTRSWAWIPTLDPVPQFLEIADARKVFALIQEGVQPHPVETGR